MIWIDYIRRGQLLGWRTIRNAIRQAGATPTGGRGINVVGSGPYATIYESRRQWSRRVQLLIRIGASTLVGDNQWTYEWVEVRKNGPGYAGWEIKPEGRTHVSHGVAYNFAEQMNSASGVQGNGVNVDDLPGTFALQPVPDGRPLLAVILTFAADSTKEVWFDQDNGIGGDCELPAGAGPGGNGAVPFIPRRRS